MPKIQRLPNGQLVLTIPKRLAEFKSWRKGDNIAFHDSDKNSFIIKKEVTDLDGGQDL